MSSSWIRIWGACFAAAVAFGALPSGASAEESDEAPDYGRTGLYIAVNFGAGVDVNTEDSLERLVRPIATARMLANREKPNADPLQIERGASGLVGVRGGWRFHPHFATELELRYRTGSNISGVSQLIDELKEARGDPDPYQPPERRSIAELTSLVVTPNIRAYALTGRFQPYAVTGFGLKWLGVGTADGSGGGPSYTGWVFRAGAGFEYYITEQVAIDLGAVYNLSGGDLKDTDYVGVVAGMICRF